MEAGPPPCSPRGRGSRGSYRTIPAKAKVPGLDGQAGTCAKRFECGRAVGATGSSSSANPMTEGKHTAARSVGRRGMRGLGVRRARACAIRRRAVRITGMRSGSGDGGNGSAWRIKVERKNPPVACRWLGGRQRPWRPPRQRPPSRRRIMRKRSCGWRNRSAAWCAGGGRGLWCGGRRRNGGGRFVGPGAVERKGGRP